MVLAAGPYAAGCRPFDYHVLYGEERKKVSLPEIFTFIIYLMVMLIVGLVFYRTTGTLSDYILGGRRLGSGVAALSAGASDMSGWLLLGLPGALYASGMNQIWIAIGLTIGAYLNWQFVARRLRVYTEHAGNSLTIPDYLENRFHDRSKLLRVISAFVILVFFTIYISSGLVGGAILFNKTFGIDYTIALYIGALVIVSYTFLGGFLAVSWTDFFQGTLMLLALLIVPLIAVDDIGGWHQACAEGIRRGQDIRRCLFRHGHARDNLAACMGDWLFRTAAHPYPFHGDGFPAQDSEGPPYWHVLDGLFPVRRDVYGHSGYCLFCARAA